MKEKSILSVLGYIIAVFVFIFLYSCASNQNTEQSYWHGDSGNDIRLAVLEPTGKGLSETEKWMLSMIQSSITGDFQKYSPMTIIDRQNLEKILGEQRQSLSGDYSDEDYISIGKITNARYILAGSVTKTANSYMLELAVTDAESGERKASYPPKAVSSFALENLSAIKEATAGLLKQLGVNLTERGLRELNTVANTSQVQAEIALARGITAQKQGTIVEALSYYIQASNYDSGLVEATSRMNILTANISSGNIGEDTRNDIAWRRQWIDRLQETEAFFANTVKDSQPFYIVYSTNIQQGRIDYQKETIDLNVWMGFYPDFAWANQINGVISAVKNGLQATKRASIWGIDWPTQTVSNPSPFINQTKNSTSTVVMEIVNNEGRSIGRQTVRAPYGFEISNTIVTPLWQWEGNVSFLAVDANLITDKLTIRIASIDEIEAENAAQQKKISVMPETEWKVMLRKNSVTRRSIEGARNRQKVERVQQQKQRDREQQQREKTQLAQQQQQEKLQRAQTFFDQGRRNFDIRNYNRAITDFTEAIKLNPNLYEAYFQRARVYSELNRYDRAIADYTQVIQLLPNDWGAYNNRGLAYHKKGDYDRAITDYNQAIQMNPNNAAGYHNRGDVYFDKKNWRMAIADYTEAIRINPNYALSYNNRGVAYRNIGEENRAIADFTDALRLNPHSALYRYNHQ